MAAEFGINVLILYLTMTLQVKGFIKRVVYGTAYRYLDYLDNMSLYLSLTDMHGFLLSLVMHQGV